MLPSNQNRIDYKLPLLVIILSLLLGVETIHLRNSSFEKLNNTRFQQLVANATTQIELRFENHLNLLRALAIHSDQNDPFSEDNWKQSITQLNFPNHAPSIQRIGLLTLSSLEAETTKHISLYSLKDSGDLDQEKPFKLQIDTALREIILEQKFNQRPTFVPFKTNLSSERPHGPITHILLYPVLPTSHSEGGEENLTKWICAAFSIQDFFNPILKQEHWVLDLSVNSGFRETKESPIFTSNAAIKNLPPEEANYLFFADHPFSFQWFRGENFDSQSKYGAFFSGATITVAGFAFAIILIHLRKTNLRTQQHSALKAQELQQVNDALTQEIEERTKAEKTAEDAREAAERANKIKGDFLATVSHEIRTPMNSVIGFAELLDHSKLTTEQKMWANHIQTSGIALLRIINDILNISKLESGQMDLESAPFSPRKTIQESVDSMTAMAGEKGLVIRYKEESNLPDAIIGDVIRVKQLMTNLLSNAVKFTDHGYICIYAKWLSQSDTTGTFQFRVEDTGIGIETNNLERLFEKFTQADSSTTRRFGGTGLGLAICLRIAELMNGKIHAESEINKGTTFFVEIPFTTTAPLREQSTNETVSTKSNESPQEDEKISVLMVDDNLVNQKLGATILTRLGCTVNSAADGAEAVQKVKAHDYSIIFMDCQMPIMNGYDATIEIRRMEENGELSFSKKRQKIQIIALTAGASNDTEEQCLAVGMDSFIRKPSRISDFKNVIDEFREQAQRSL